MLSEAEQSLARMAGPRSKSPNPGANLEYGMGRMALYYAGKANLIKLCLS